MWVMKKEIKGKEYLYLYRSVWENGKPRNKFIRYLGLREKYSEATLKKIIEEEKAREELASFRGGTQRFDLSRLTELSAGNEQVANVTKVFEIAFGPKGELKIEVKKGVGQEPRDTTVGGITLHVESRNYVNAKVSEEEGPYVAVVLSKYVHNRYMPFTDAEEQAIRANRLLFIGKSGRRVVQGESAMEWEKFVQQDWATTPIGRPKISIIARMPVDETQHMNEYVIRRVKQET